MNNEANPIRKPSFDKLCAGVAKMLSERKRSYCSPNYVALTYRLIKSFISEMIARSEFSPSDTEVMALDMIALKIARVIFSSPEKRMDSWRDIAGYAILALESLGDGDDGNT